jgi:simple sugar transport system permease protein
LIIILGVLAGVVGGAVWASLAGALKVFGGVNEIFGGLGLNFVATALTIYLVFGPWKRPGVGSMSGTQPFEQRLWLPTLHDSELSLWALGISILVVVFVYFLLRGTHFGLRLKAVGKNPKAAFLMGIPTWQYSIFAFMLCGAFAGLAGAIQVSSVYHRLLPNISNGYGFLGLLVAMLINYHAFWAAPIAFIFAALNIGSVQLQILYKLDSSFAGVLQDLLVLLLLLAEGARHLLRNLTSRDGYELHSDRSCGSSDGGSTTIVCGAWRNDHRTRRSHQSFDEWLNPALSHGGIRRRL